MTPEPPQGSATEGVRSLEVRWIFPGQLETAVAEWFGRFPAERQEREDTYLLDTWLRGLSVKVRGGAALEVKEYRGSPGLLDLAGRACGRMEFWRKSSFPVDPPRGDGGDLAGWIPVRKRRRISRFSLAGGPAAAQSPGRGREPWCAAELTEVGTPGHDWWTLGFEATGPEDQLRGTLQAAAQLVFALAMPGSTEPSPAVSSSYTEWLCQLRVAETTPAPEDGPSLQHPPAARRPVVQEPASRTSSTRSRGRGGASPLTISCG
jgi:hypothetical protein